MREKRRMRTVITKRPIDNEFNIEKKESRFNVALLDDLVDYHFRKIKPRYMKYQKLYEGKAKIFKRARMKEKNKPCNKIANDFCGQIIDTTVGYFLGNPITINYTEKENKAVGTQTAEADVGVDLKELKTTDTAVQDELDGILQENYRDDLFMEWGKECMIKTILRKEVTVMAVIYATLIIKGKKTFAEVPAVLKDKVKEILIDLELPELAE